MSLHKAPSGRWRAQVWDASKRRNVAVSQILGPDYASFRTKAEAKAARELARNRLKRPTGGLTVADFRDRWLSDALFARPKGSTMIHNGERTRPFAQRYGTVPMRDVGDEIVGEWLAGGNRNGQVPALRAMWNDATSAKAGRVVESNPWAKLGLKRTEGNKRKQPPPEDQVWEMIRYARELTSPFYAAWLRSPRSAACGPASWTCCATGPAAPLLRRLRRRPDLRQRAVERQGAPAHPPEERAQARGAADAGRARGAAIPAAGEQEERRLVVREHPRRPLDAVGARLPLEGGPRRRRLEGEPVPDDAPLRRLVHDQRPRAVERGRGDRPGHEDGGQLVRTLYGHRERALALDRVAAAYDRTANVRPLRVVRGDAG